MNYDIFLKGLCWFFRIQEEGDKYRLLRSYKDTGIEIIDMAILKDLYEKTSDINFDECEILYDQDENKYLEVIISDDSPFPFYYRRVEESNFSLLSDETNGLEYEITTPSALYLVWYLKRVLEQFDYPNNMENDSLQILKRRYFDKLRRGRIDRMVEDRSNEGAELNQISVIDILKAVNDWNVLLISKSKNSDFDLKQALNSYSYTYMRNLQLPFKVYKFQDTLPIQRKNQDIRTIEFEAPKRIYNSDFLDYYHLAVASNDPFVEFISYYHIIEYLYDEVFREHQIESLKQAITAPTFSYKDNDKIFNVIQTILKDNKHIRENGSGNEQQSLNYVLNKYISDLGTFKNRFKEDELNYYKQNVSKFSKGNIIDWDKEHDKVIKAISNRIYKNRNSLIHSKSSYKDETYHPYKDREYLKYEIPLIKNIAETIIEEHSAYL